LALFISIVSNSLKTKPIVVGFSLTIGVLSLLRGFSLKNHGAMTLFLYHVFAFFKKTGFVLSICQGNKSCKDKKLIFISIIIEPLTSSIYRIKYKL
jgi:hypothetical protein